MPTWVTQNKNIFMDGPALVFHCDFLVSHVCKILNSFLRLDMNMHTHAHTCARTHACVHAHMCTHVHTCAQHTSTCAHAHAKMHIHTQSGFDRQHAVFYVKYYSDIYQKDNNKDLCYWTEIIGQHTQTFNI